MAQPMVASAVAAPLLSRPVVEQEHQLWKMWSQEQFDCEDAIDDFQNE
jgi:hypothetical protein